jgi:hypothetical protein
MDEVGDKHGRTLEQPDHDKIAGERRDPRGDLARADRTADAARLRLGHPISGRAECQ